MNHNKSSLSAASRILSLFPDVRRTSTGWRAKCPAHHDRRASLSIAIRDDGRVLLRCHAGCRTEAVVAAIGLSMADLMPPRGDGKVLGAAASNGAPATNGRVFPAAKAALAALARKLGAPAATWIYRNAAGEPVGVVARWDRAGGGKEIRPVSRAIDGTWRIGAMPEPRPLYRLVELVEAQRVYVVEGEKCVEAARSLGLVATTSSGGAAAAEKSDWSPLAGKEVVILPDGDAAGRAYGEHVAELLSRLSPRPTIKIVDLPGLPPGADIADVLAAPDWCGLPLGDAAEPSDLAAYIGRLAAETEPWQPVADEAADLRFTPFPTDSLPEPLRAFTTTAAAAMGCDASYIALPLLVAAASMIGNTRRLQLKRGWSVPPILWGVLVGESGTLKSPALRLALRAVYDMQREAREKHERENARYLQDLQVYERELANWKKRKGGDDPPVKPAPPIAMRYVVSDTTLEAVATVLAQNPRGVLLARDELAGWFGGFDRYAATRRGDVAHWLSTYNAEQILIDRKTGEKKVIYVPRAAVCVIGCAQPAILARLLSTENRDNGLAARLLVTHPPRRKKEWSEIEIDAETEAAVAGVFARLSALEGDVVGDDETGAPKSEPRLVRLTPEARRVWLQYYEDHAAEQLDLTGDLAAAWSKLEEIAARLALVIHFVRVVAGDVADEDRLDRESMAAGCALATWFKNEARRLYATVIDPADDDPAARQRRELVEFIDRRGGEVTVRDLKRWKRYLRKPGAAEAALDELVTLKLGRWKKRESNRLRGRPTLVFRLGGGDTLALKPEK